ncbi:MAG TPA: lysophospholipid acyltransferase family protein [Candidatus Acidoferrales bacterium]|nr:lysophospholipid acyltransferase family protein [Candidatus Acidoferrales bacterium]
MTDGGTVGPTPVHVPLIYRLEYAGFRLAFALFAALPRNFVLRLGAWLGEVFYLLDFRDRRVALFNLAIAFPEKTLTERRRILRASCRNLGRVVAEFCHLPQLDAAHLPNIVSFADRAAWDRAIDAAAQHGAVIATAHFGNWELLAYAHSLLGHPVTLVHRPMHNPLFDAAITAIRSAAGTQLIKKKAAAKEALRVLKQHGILVVPSDQNQTHSFGVFVDFFGKPACTTPGAARLAMLTGAPVYPVFLVREGETGTHRIEMLPEIEMASTGDREVDIRTNTQRCSAVIEEMIRRYPEQWIWLHKRWKTRPPGEPRLYT